jgi:hypothetical protein
MDGHFEATPAGYIPDRSTDGTMGRLILNNPLHHIHILLIHKMLFYTRCLHTIVQGIQPGGYPSPDRRQSGGRYQQKVGIVAGGPRSVIVPEVCEEAPSGKDRRPMTLPSPKRTA